MISLIDVLTARVGDDWRIIHSRDGDRDALYIGKCASGSCIAEVAGRDIQGDLTTIEDIAALKKLAESAKA